MVLTIAVALAQWGCATVDFDRQADLSKFRSFGWGKSKVSVANPAYKSDLIDATIKSRIRGELEGKGLTFKTSKPDAVVSYESYTERKMGSNGSAIYYQYYYFPAYSPGIVPYGAYAFGGPIFLAPSEYFSHTEGTLAIDIRDRRTGKLVWRGLVQGNVDNIEKLHKTIARAVAAIMKKYPTLPPPPVPLPKGKVSS